MSHIDTLIAQHVDEARKTVAGLDVPPIRYAAHRRWTGVVPPIAWAAVAAAIVLIAFAFPIWLSGDSESETVDSIPIDTMELQGFQPTRPMTGSCAWCRAVLLDDGTVLVVGGVDADGAVVEIFDPDNATFSMVGRPQGNYGQGSAVKLSDGRVLMVSALDEMAEIFDPATQEVEVTGSPVGGAGGVVVALDDGRALLVRGDASAEAYDPNTGEFTPTGSMTFEGSNLAVTPLLDGRVLVVGGRRADTYSPDTGRFTAAGPRSWRGASTATLLADGRVLIVGGGKAHRLAELFDPDTDTFSPTGSLSIGRFWSAPVLRPDGRVLFFGGNNDGDRLSDIEVYDPAIGGFTPLPVTMSTPRFAATAVLLEDGRVLILGNYGGNGGNNLNVAGSTAEVLGVDDETAPGCCPDNPTVFEVTTTLISTGSLEVFVSVPAGGLEGATQGRYWYSATTPDGGGGGGGEAPLPSDCSQGCVFSLPEMNPPPVTGEVTVGFQIGYEGKTPPAAQGIELSQELAGS